MATAPSPETAFEQRVAVGLAVALVLFYAASSGAWALTDQAAPWWDQSRHAINALRLLEALQTVAKGELSLGDLAVWHDNHFLAWAYFPTSAAHLIFGPSFDVAQCVMACFWTPLALGSCWWVAFKVLHSRLAATAALAWLGACPLTVDLSKDYLIDLPILAMLALTLALLLQSNLLHRPGWAAACGISAGGLMLIKAVATASFLIPPLAITLYAVERRHAWGAHAKGLMVAGLAMGILALPVHLRWLPDLLSPVQYQQQLLSSQVEGDPQTLWGAAWLHVNYLFDLEARGFLLPWLVAGAVMAWRFQARVLWVVLGCFFFSELVWVAFPNQDVRYGYPALVYLAVLAGALVRAGRNPQQRLGLLGLMALVMMFHVVTIQWGSSLLPQEVALAPGWRVWAQKGYLRGAPDLSPSLAARMAVAVTQSQRTRPGPPLHRPLMRVDVTGNEPSFNPWNIEHAAYAQGRPFEVEDSLPALTPSFDHVIWARCGQESPPDDLFGFVELISQRTLGGCHAHLMENQRLREVEAVLRGVTEHPQAYAVGAMAQTLTRVQFTSVWGVGSLQSALLQVRVGAHRRAGNLERTLWLGTQPLTTWETLDGAWRAPWEYALEARFTVPPLALGEYPLTLSITDPRHPQERAVLALGRVLLKARAVE